jgi:predicted CopG family antitoxin
MVKRTTVMLDEDIYPKLVEISLRKYGTVKALSRVLNELLRDTLQGKEEILRLIYSNKIAKTTAKEFEEFREELSRRFES